MTGDLKTGEGYSRSSRRVEGSSGLQIDEAQQGDPCIACPMFSFLSIMENSMTSPNLIKLEVRGSRALDSHTTNIWLRGSMHMKYTDIC